MKGKKEKRKKRSPVSGIGVASVRTFSLSLSLTLILTLTLVVMLGGCAGLRGIRGPEEAETEQGAGAELARADAVEEPEKRPELPPFQNDYEREDFIRALVQLDEIRRSMDSFRRYMWGDRVFEDTIASITWLASEPLLPGQGVVLVYYDEQGGEYLKITRGWIEKGAFGELWWKMSLTTRDKSFVCEVSVNDAGVPQHIYVRDNASGEFLERKTFYSDMMEGEGGPSGQADGRAKSTGQAGPTGQNERSGTADTGWFDRIRREEYQAKVLPLYEGLEIVGEEVIQAGGRWVRAVRMHSAPVTGASALEAWFSPDVSGRVLRIALSGGRTIVEARAFEAIELELPLR
jgi:hypothetical protein